MELARLTETQKNRYDGTDQGQENKSSSVGYDSEGNVYIDIPNDGEELDLLSAVRIDETDQQAELAQSTWSESLYGYGVGVFNFSMERMKDAGIYNRFNRQFYPDQYQYDVLQHNLQFNEQFNEQCSDLSFIRSELHYLDKNNKQTANLFNREQFIAIFEKLKADILNSVGVGKVTLELASMIELLKANNSVHLNIKEKAKISLSFDKILVEWKKGLGKTEEKIAVSGFDEEASGQERRGLPPTKMMTELIDDLQLACKLQYVESAHEIICFELAQVLKNDWKLGSLRSTTYKGSFSATTELSPLGHSAGGGLSGFYEELKFTDPEGYCNIFRWVYGGLSAEAKAIFGAAIPGRLSAELFVSGNANAQGIYGKFWEPKTPQTYAAGEFKTLIKDPEHRDNPNITSHFSRVRLLDKNLSTQLNSELEYVLNEVDEIEQLRLDFNAIKEDMDHRLSLYMQPLLFPEQIVVYASDFADRETKEEFLALPLNKPTFASFPIKAPPDEITKATITGAVTKLVVGSNSRLTIGTASEKNENIHGGLSLVVSGSGEAIVRFRDEVKRTLIGLRLVDGTKSTAEKDSIRHQVAERFDVFREVIIRAVSAAKNEPQKCIDFNITTNEALKNHSDYLKQDFNQYRKLHAGRVGREYGTVEQKQKVLREFEKRYGATRPEELIHRMQIASIYLLTYLDIENPKNEYLIEDILQFEKALSNPPFAVDKNYLEDHLYFLEDLRITYFDAKFDLATKASALLGGKSGVDREVTTDKARVKGSGEGSRNAQFKVNVTYSWLGAHLNKWRRGHLLQLHVTYGAGGNVEAMIKAIEPDFKKHLPEDLAQYALAELKKKLLAEMALSVSFTREETFDFTIGKPDKFSPDSEGFEFKHLFSRTLKTDIRDATGKITVPVGPAKINLGGGYISVKTDPVPLSEICEPNTVIQFFILCMHEYHVGGIDKFTGVVAKDSYWNTIEQEQESRIKQFLINFADEPDFEPDPQFDFQPDKRPAGAISKEIFEIEKAIHQNDNYLRQVRFMFENECRASTDPVRRFELTQKIAAITVAITTHNKSNLLGEGLEEFNFRIARDKLKSAACLFRDSDKKIDSASEDDEIVLVDDDSDTDSPYKKALSCFRNLMFIDYPQWFDCRSNSPDLKPRPLANVDNADTMVQQRLQQAQASVLGIVVQDSYV